MGGSELMDQAAQSGDLMLAGTSDLNLALAQEGLKRQFISQVLKQGEDYGIVPGTKKKGLFKPGSEKLLFYHGLGVRLEAGANTVIDWKVPFFAYEYKAIAYHKRSGIAIAECIGSANSAESRYAYLWVQESKIPRGVSKEDLVSKKGKVWIKGKEEWVELYRIDNPEIRGLMNTICKIAQKRAVTGVALIACRASTDFEAVDDDEQHGGEDGDGADGGGSGEGATKPAGDAISEGKLKRVYALLKAHKVSNEALNEYLKKNNPETLDGGDIHYSRIHWKKYDAVCAWIEAGGK